MSENSFVAGVVVGVICATIIVAFAYWQSGDRKNSTGEEKDNQEAG